MSFLTFVASQRRDEASSPAATAAVEAAAAAAASSGWRVGQHGTRRGGASQKVRVYIIVEPLNY